MSSFVLFILLCLSLHACDARLLRLTYKENGKQVYQHSSRDAEYTKVLETSITSSLRPTTLEKCISRKKAVKNDGRDSEDSRGGVNRQNETTVLSKKEDRANGATSGNEKTKESFFRKDLQQARDMKGLERKVRSLQDSAQHDNSEETGGVKENEAVEDIVVMDYAQPHRKPPIHNERP